MANVVQIEEPRKVHLSYVKTDEAGNEDVAVLSVNMAVRSLGVRNRYFSVVVKHQEEAAKVDARNIEERAALEVKERATFDAQKGLETQNLLAGWKRELFLQIVDTKQNKTEEKALLNSSIDSQFWQTVNFEKVEEEIEYFRTQLAIRQ